MKEPLQKAMSDLEEVERLLGDKGRLFGSDITVSVKDLAKASRRVHLKISILKADIKTLRETAAEVIKISDRDHLAWDRLKTALEITDRGPKTALEITDREPRKRRERSIRVTKKRRDALSDLLDLYSTIAESADPEFVKSYEGTVNTLRGMLK